MADELDSIADSILAVLRASAVPLKVPAIADDLEGQGVSITKWKVNSVLYGVLSQEGKVAQDSEYRWSLVGQCGGGIANVGREVQAAGHAPECEDESVSQLESRRDARRVLQVLRSRTTSCRAVKAISVGTELIEQEIYSLADSLLNDGTTGALIVVAADWGFGKSHMRMLLSSHLSKRGIPFAYECVDARAASLAHIHRSIPRWLERMQLGRTVGLRDALNNGLISGEKALEWAINRGSEFANGLYWALKGYEGGWLQALGHLCRSPDYPYQHSKAWAILGSAATFLNKMGRGGLVILLDEAENIDKQYDIRGRRKSYETLTLMMRHPHILPVVFVTDRFLYQVEQDKKHGAGRGWWNWSPEAKWFVSNFPERQPLRPPRMSEPLAEELVKRIEELYRRAYVSSSRFSPQRILEHWRRTPTRSTRLLVRLTVNELDLMAQNGADK